MIPLLVDQNFNEHIVDGPSRRNAAIDVIHVREVDLAAATDKAILEWAAAHDRVLLTHDRKTVPPIAHSRVESGLLMPGIFLVSSQMQVGDAIEELLIAISCLSADECGGVVRYFPLKRFASRSPLSNPPAPS